MAFESYGSILITHMLWGIRLLTPTLMVKPVNCVILYDIVILIWEPKAHRVQNFGSQIKMTMQNGIIKIVDLQWNQFLYQWYTIADGSHQYHVQIGKSIKITIRLEFQNWKSELLSARCYHSNKPMLFNCCNGNQLSAHHIDQRVRCERDSQYADLRGSQIFPRCSPSSELLWVVFCKVSIMGIPLMQLSSPCACCSNGMLFR